MVIMYKFWKHFLIRNFNARMYNEFRFCCIEDATVRHNYTGLNALLQYYGKAMHHKEITIRNTVARDYVDLVRGEPLHSDRPAFKVMKNAWRDGSLNMKNRKRIKDFLDPALEKELDN
jgi:la-related protein 1